MGSEASPNLIYPPIPPPPTPPAPVNLTDTYTGQMAVTMSSVDGSNTGPKAIDNNTGTQARTNRNDNEWLGLGLGSDFEVTQVQVRMTGSDATRMNGAVVSLRDAGSATVHSFAAITGATNNATLSFTPPEGVVARSVHIAGTTSEQVRLTELDVMGRTPQPPPPPPPPVTVARPHAPTSICGTAVTYDANGNTLSYDADGPGPLQPRTFTYDGENRPLTITQNANVASFAYAPDGERAGKSFGGNAYSYLGNDAEFLVNSANPSGLLTSNLHPDVKREGLITAFAHKDHLASYRLVSFMAGGQPTTRHDYGP